MPRARCTAVPCCYTRAAHACTCYMLRYIPAPSPQLVAPPALSPPHPTASVLACFPFSALSCTTQLLPAPQCYRNSSSSLGGGHPRPPAGQLEGDAFGASAAPAFGTHAHVWRTQPSAGCQLHRSLALVSQAPSCASHISASAVSTFKQYACQAVLSPGQDMQVNRLPPQLPRPVPAAASSSASGRLHSNAVPPEYNGSESAGAAAAGAPASRGAASPA